MPDCNQLDPLVTPYVDGHLSAADREIIEDHLRICGRCQARILGERAVRDLLHARRSALMSDRASPVLRARCAAARAGVASGAHQIRPPRWRRWVVPAALAASLVLLVGGAFLYELTDRSAGVLVAELTADHVKCFGLNGVFGTHQDPATAERILASSFDWTPTLPDRPERAGLELVGARPCLYGEGRVAHLMYRHHGHPVSVFMLPKTTRSEQIVEVMGHEAAIWSFGDRTFVLVAREGKPEVEQMAAFVQAGLR